MKYVIKTNTIKKSIIDSSVDLYLMSRNIGYLCTEFTNTWKCLGTLLQTMVRTGTVIFQMKLLHRKINIVQKLEILFYLMRDFLLENTGIEEFPGRENSRTHTNRANSYFLNRKLESILHSLNLNTKSIQDNVMCIL